MLFVVCIIRHNLCEIDMILYFFHLSSKNLTNLPKFLHMHLPLWLAVNKARCCLWHKSSLTCAFLLHSFAFSRNMFNQYGWYFTRAHVMIMTYMIRHTCLRSMVVIEVLTFEDLKLCCLEFFKNWIRSCRTLPLLIFHFRIQDFVNVFAIWEHFYIWGLLVVLFPL